MEPKFASHTASNQTESESRNAAARVGNADLVPTACDMSTTQSH